MSDRLSVLFRVAVAINSLALIYLLLTTLVWGAGGWVTVWHWVAGIAALVLSYAMLALDIWRD